MHVSTKFEANRSKNAPTVAKTNFRDVTTSDPHDTRPDHTYVVLKFKEDWLRNKKVHSLVNMVAGGWWWWSSNELSFIVP